MAISVDEREDSASLAETLAIPYPLLCDPDRKTMSAYGVDDADAEVAIPAVFLIDAAGFIRWRIIGESKLDRPSIEEVLTQVDAIRDSP